MSKNLKKGMRKRRPRRTYRKRRVDINIEAIDFKNVDLLKKFLTENGRILPRKITHLSVRIHRKLNREIKRARNILLIK